MRGRKCSGRWVHLFASLKAGNTQLFLPSLALHEQGDPLLLGLAIRCHVHGKQFFPWSRAERH